MSIRRTIRSVSTRGSYRNPKPSRAERGKTRKSKKVKTTAFDGSRVTTIRVFPINPTALRWAALAFQTEQRATRFPTQQETLAAHLRKKGIDISPIIGAGDDINELVLSALLGVLLLPKTAAEKAQKEAMRRLRDSVARKNPVLKVTPELLTSKQGREEFLARVAAVRSPKLVATARRLPRIPTFAPGHEQRILPPGLARRLLHGIGFREEQTALEFTDDQGKRRMLDFGLLSGEGILDKFKMLGTADTAEDRLRQTVIAFDNKAVRALGGAEKTLPVQAFGTAAGGTVLGLFVLAGRRALDPLGVSVFPLDYPQGKEYGDKSVLGIVLALLQYGIWNPAADRWAGRLEFALPGNLTTPYRRKGETIELERTGASALGRYLCSPVATYAGALANTPLSISLNSGANAASVTGSLTAGTSSYHLRGSFDIPTKTLTLENSKGVRVEAAYSNQQKGLAGVLTLPEDPESRAFKVRRESTGSRCPSSEFKQAMWQASKHLAKDAQEEPLPWLQFFAQKNLPGRSTLLTLLDTIQQLGLEVRSRPYLEEARSAFLGPKQVQPPARGGLPSPLKISWEQTKRAKRYRQGQGYLPLPPHETASASLVTTLFTSRKLGEFLTLPPEQAAEVGSQSLILHRSSEGRFYLFLVTAREEGDFRVKELGGHAAAQLLKSRLQDLSSTADNLRSSLATARSTVSQIFERFSAGIANMSLPGAGGTPILSIVGDTKEDGVPRYLSAADWYGDPVEERNWANLRRGLRADRWSGTESLKHPLPSLAAMGYAGDSEASEVSKEVTLDTYRALEGREKAAYKDALWASPPPKSKGPRVLGLDHPAILSVVFTVYGYRHPRGGHPRYLSVRGTDINLSEMGSYEVLHQTLPLSHVGLRDIAAWAHRDAGPAPLPKKGENPAVFSPTAAIRAWLFRGGWGRRGPLKVERTERIYHTIDFGLSEAQENALLHRFESGATAVLLGNVSETGFVGGKGGARIDSFPLPLDTGITTSLAKTIQQEGGFTTIQGVSFMVSPRPNGVFYLTPGSGSRRVQEVLPPLKQAVEAATKAEKEGDPLPVPYSIVATLLLDLANLPAGFLGSVLSVGGGKGIALTSIRVPTASWGSNLPKTAEVDSVLTPWVEGKVTDEGELVPAFPQEMFIPSSMPQGTILQLSEYLVQARVLKGGFLTSNLLSKRMRPNLFAFSEMIRTPRFARMFDRMRQKTDGDDLPDLLRAVYTSTLADGLSGSSRRLPPEEIVGERHAQQGFGGAKARAKRIGDRLQAPNTEGARGTEVFQNRQSVFRLATDVCSATGMCSNAQVGKRGNVAGLVAGVTLVNLRLSRTQARDLLDTMDEGGSRYTVTLPKSVRKKIQKAGKAAYTQIQNNLFRVVLAADETATLIPESKSGSEEAHLLAAMTKHKIRLPTDRDPKKLHKALKALRDKIEVDYTHQATAGQLLEKARQTHASAEEISQSEDYEASLRDEADRQVLISEFLQGLLEQMTKPNPKERVSRRGGRSLSRRSRARRNPDPSKYLTADEIAGIIRFLKGEAGASAEAAQEALRKLEAISPPAQWAVTQRKLNALFPRKGTEKPDTWRLGERLPTLREYNLVSRVRSPDKESGEYRGLVGSWPDIQARAELSAEETEQILKMQSTARGRHFTMRPSSAICSMYRSRRLTTYTPPAGLLRAVGNNILIWLSPDLPGALPRVMTFRRGTRIDCDFTGTGDQVSFLLGKAIQSSLYWLAEKPGRKNTTVYVGRVGDPFLKIAWQPRDGEISLAKVADSLRTEGNQINLASKPIGYDPRADEDAYREAVRILFSRELQQAAPAPRAAKEKTKTKKRGKSKDPTVAVAVEELGLDPRFGMGAVGHPDEE